jgi:hypothetical protein
MQKVHTESARGAAAPGNDVSAASFHAVFGQGHLPTTEHGVERGRTDVVAWSRGTPCGFRVHLRDLRAEFHEHFPSEPGKRLDEVTQFGKPQPLVRDLLVQAEPAP